MFYHFYLCLEVRKRNPIQPGSSQPGQMTPRPQIQSPGPHFNNGQYPQRMPPNQFQGTPQFRGECTDIYCSVRNKKKIFSFLA